MEDYSAYPKSNLTSVGNSKGTSFQGRARFHGEKKRKWEEPPHNKEKKLPQEKLKLVAGNVIPMDRWVTLLRRVLNPAM
jgi:hypothetical protein